MESFDIALKVKAKHGKIYKYMIENNLSYDAMAKQIGISKATLCSLLHFRWNPTNQYQSKIVKQKLEHFFGCSIETLFPKELTKQIQNNKELRNLLQKTQIVHKKIDIEYLPFNEVPEIPYYEENHAENREITEIIDKVLGTLRPREEQIIKMRFGLDGEGGKTLEEIGCHFNVTRDRIMQIEKKALRKIKHPSRLKILKEANVLKGGD